MQQFSLPSFADINMDDYRQLTHDEMPNRETLRDAGYTAKFPLFYRGSNTNPDLAKIYVHAHTFGWTDVIERRTIPRGIPVLLARMGMYRGMEDLFQHRVLPEQYTIMHRLFDAYALLGVSHDDARSVIMHRNAADVLKSIAARNNVAHIGHLDTPQLALTLLMTASLRNIAKETGNLTALGLEDWHPLAFWLDYENQTVIYKYFSLRLLIELYTLDELLVIFTRVKTFDPDMCARAILLRQHVAVSLPLAEVLSYLTMPVGLFNDFFATVSVKP